MNLLSAISMSTGFSASDIERIIQTAPKRYKQYPIPKKSGGYRIIAQPSQELKLLQRFLTDEWLNKLPIHEAATAYAKKRSILINARAHVNSRVILKLDFESFFPSIRARDWIKYTERNPIPWDGPGDEERVLNLLFWGVGNYKPVCLSIGAPTSPIVSNLLMFEFDTIFAAKAKSLEVAYTRYADDITISAQTVEPLQIFERFVRSSLRKIRSPKLTVNEKKKGRYHSGQRRMVTGLILTPDGQVSLGRARKREIASLIHRFTLGQLDAERVGYLKGMIAFAIANDPEFIGRMRRKYDDKVIESLLSLQLPKRQR